MDPHLVPTILAATAGGTALLGESQRLPPQNVAALALITPLMAWGIEAIAQSVDATITPGTLHPIATTTAALLTSRLIARLPGPGPDHLYQRTVAFGLALVAAAQWPQEANRDTLAALLLRCLILPPALLILAPWWINKRLQPRSVPIAYALTGPVFLLALALHSATRGQLPIALIQSTTAGVFLAWFCLARNR